MFPCPRSKHVDRPASRLSLVKHECMLAELPEMQKLQASSLGVVYSVQ